MDSSPTLILVTISGIRAKNFAILLLTAFEQVLFKLQLRTGHHQLENHM